MSRAASTTAHHRSWRLAAPGLAVVMTAAVLSAAPALAAVRPANTVELGQAPVAIATDAADHTAYVLTSGPAGDQVAVVNTNACTARASSACTAAVANVTLEPGAGAAGIAVDAASHTVFVADATTGDISMIRTSTCDASATSGCDAAPVVGLSGLASPTALAVDDTGGHDVVYVADTGSGQVSVFSGAACNATTTRGCTTTRAVTVGGAPSSIAVDAAVGTTYVASAGTDSVALLSETACRTMSAGCSSVGRTVPLGAGESPVAMVADPADATVFVADASTGDVSFLDTTRCTYLVTDGCSATPRVLSGLAAAGIAMTSQGDVAIADTATHQMVAFEAATCDAAVDVGCIFTENDSLGGSPSALATSGVTIYAADAGNDRLDIVATPSVVVKITTAHRLSRYDWYRSPVTVSYTCTAGTADLDSKCTGPVKVTKNTAGRSFGTALTSDDGGWVTAGAFVRLDTTKPTVRVTGVVNGKHYAVGHHPSLHCVVTDSLSGPASCVITRHTRGFRGHNVIYLATATDKAGNVAHAHGRFTLS